MAESAIRRCRKQAGLTQQALADVLGVSKQNVCCWENGYYDPSPRKAIALTKVLRSLTFEQIYAAAEGEGA